MFRVLQNLFHIVDRSNEAIAKLIAWCVLGLVLTMSYEVMARYVFGRPTAWSYDISYFLNSLVVVFGAAYTLHRGGHVSIDVIHAKFPLRVRAAFDLVCTLVLFIPLWTLLLWTMAPHIQQSWVSQERALTGTWLPPIYPFKAWIFIGLLLLLVQGIVEAARTLLVLLRGDREV